jgi:uncharacterized cupin superfamily protein
MLETVLKRFEKPDEVRVFEKRKIRTYPHRWDDHRASDIRTGMEMVHSCGAERGRIRCNVEHVGLVLSGCATAAMEDGTIHALSAGTLFYIPPGPPGHDSWVVGDAPHISLHFLGADTYANQ